MKLTLQWHISSINPYTCISICTSNSTFTNHKTCRNSYGTCDEWEVSLSDQEEELKVLQELGLEVAIDITARRPWVTKSAFQAKPVTRKELVVFNESNRSHRSREQVETHTSIQQGLESSQILPHPSTSQLQLISTEAAVGQRPSTARQYWHEWSHFVQRLPWVEVGMIQSAKKALKETYITGW